MSISKRRENRQLRLLLSDGIEAIRLTREYVMPAVSLPAKAGWSWFDWTERAKEALQP